MAQHLEFELTENPYYDSDVLSVYCFKKQFREKYSTNKRRRHHNIEQSWIKIITLKYFFLQNKFHPITIITPHQ